jgi:hypothetical protein
VRPAREVGEVLVADRRFQLDLVGERAQPGAEDDRRLHGLAEALAHRLCTGLDALPRVQAQRRIAEADRLVLLRVLQLRK